MYIHVYIYIYIYTLSGVDCTHARQELAGVEKENPRTLAL